MSDNGSFNVAIIGAGMGGATAAYYLRQLFQKQVSITLFEKSGRAGGRVHSFQMAGRICEGGASIFHSANKYMINFAKQFDLTINTLSGSDERTLFFDENYRPVFSTFGGPSFLTNLRTIWHYGYDVVRVLRYTTSLMRDFSKIYKLQDDGRCFTTPAGLLKCLRPEFIQMTKTTYGEWLKTYLKLRTATQDELAFGLISNNYCQNFNVHAFVGFTSMATMVPKLCAIKDGNDQIPSRLIQLALKDNPPDVPTSLVHATVTKIKNTKSTDKYTLTYFENGDVKRRKETEFDYVIIAAPLHQQSELIGSDQIQLPRITYQEVDHLFVYGDLLTEQFGIKTRLNNNHQICSFLPTRRAYTTPTNNDLVRSIISLPSVHDDKTRRLWTVFSEPKVIPEPEKTIVTRFFNKHIPLEHVIKKWLAYPTYKPVNDPEQEFIPFLLASRLYYANAIEQIASCMEMAAIGGRNTALLVYADRKREIDSDKISNSTKEH